MAVDLPEPLSPMKAANVPAGMSSEMPRSAGSVRCGYVNQTWLNVTGSAPHGRGCAGFSLASRSTGLAASSRGSVRSTAESSIENTFDADTCALVKSGAKASSCPEDCAENSSAGSTMKKATCEYRSSATLREPHQYAKP